MSLLFDLYYNTFEVEDKIFEIKESNEIVELKNKLLEGVDNENYNALLNKLISRLVDKMDDLMYKERENALRRGVKIGLELQKFFKDDEIF